MTSVMRFSPIRHGDEAHNYKTRIEKKEIFAAQVWVMELREKMEE